MILLFFVICVLSLSYIAVKDIRRMDIEEFYKEPSNDNQGEKNG